MGHEKLKRSHAREVRALFVAGVIALSSLALLFAGTAPSTAGAVQSAVGKGRQLRGAPQRTQRPTYWAPGSAVR